MRKKNIISVVLSVLLSVVFVAVAANAATTISTDITTGGTLTVTGVSALTGAVTTTAGITSGANIVSDTDSTDNLGATATRWLATFSDNFTGNTITLDGATGVNVITITDSVADGLSIVRGTTDFMVFKTSAAPSLTITPATTITGALTASGGIANTGTYTGTSADASSLAVGRLGATTPAFVVDSSTGSQVAGLKITGAATGGTVAVVAIDSGAATNLTVNAKGTGTLGLGTVSTGAITIGNTSSGATTIYGGSVTNAVRILGTVGTIATEAHGLDVVTTGTFSGGVDDNLVGINSVLTTAGTAGKWASAVYGKVVQGTTQNVTGYLSGGEFEVANTNTTGAMEMFPLVLDSNSSTYSHPDSAYIWGQDFGTADMPNLLKITGNAVGALSATKMFSTYAQVTEPVTHSLKVMIDGTPYWIMMTNVAPH